MVFLLKKDSSVHLIYMGKEKKNRVTHTGSIWCSKYIICYTHSEQRKPSGLIRSWRDFTLWWHGKSIPITMSPVPRPRMHAEQSHTQLHELEFWSALWELKGGWTAGNTCASWTARVKKTLQGFCRSILYSLRSHLGGARYSSGKKPVLKRNWHDFVMHQCHPPGISHSDRCWHEEVKRQRH